MTAELVADGLEFPSSLAFDDRGAIYVAETGLPFGGGRAGGRIVRLEAGARRVVVDNLRAPLTGLVWHAGALYVSEGGHPARIARIDPADGRATTIVDGLPGPGNYHVGMVAFDREGWMYFAQGAMTNLGIVGLDAYEVGWLGRLPHAHDVPGYDIALAGGDVATPDPLRPGATARTGAFAAFGEHHAADTRLTGQTRCTASVLRCRPDGSELELLAWGLRNAFALAFAQDGRLVCIDQGADDRGSRAVANAPDLMFEVTRGAWYGWPDFIDGEPVTSPRYAPVRGERPQLLLANLDALPRPSRALHRFAPHVSAVKFDWLPGGALAIALFGDERPMTAPTGPPAGRTLAILDRGVERHVSLGLARPIDVKWNRGDEHLYVLDFGRFEMRAGGRSEATARSGRLVRMRVADFA